MQAERPCCLKAVLFCLGQENLDGVVGVGASTFVPPSNNIVLRQLSVVAFFKLKVWTPRLPGEWE